MNINNIYWWGRFLVDLVCHLAVWLIICLPLMAIGVVILYPICLLRPQISLPSAFRWWDNADLYVGRDISTYTGIWQEGPWARYCWLAWRNPINYFGYVVLGFKWDNPIVLEYNPINLGVGDGTGAHPGFLYTEIQQDNFVYPEYYYVKKWNASYCFYFRLGWKIADISQDKQGNYQQWVLSINPYKSYSGT